MGGNRHRKQGKKYQTPQSRNLRLVKEDGEMYAVCTRVFGGSNAEVRCSDGVTRKCIIRSKFRGRHRRDNRVEPGVMCMVGLRMWESSSSASTTDLLHIYTSDQKTKLCKEVGGDWSWVKDEGTCTEDQSEFAFVNDDLSEEAADVLPTEPLPTVSQIEEAIDVDDI